jgi:carbamoyl-phosphate synthase large subunit
VKFPGVDTLLGPEMKSTGEVMGIDREFGRAYAKAQIAAGNPLPLSGTVLVSLRDEDKEPALDAVRTLASAGFHLVATLGTAQFLKARGIEAAAIENGPDGIPETAEMLRSGRIDLVIVTTRIGDPQAVKRSAEMRRAALDRGTPYFTTVAGARAAAAAIRELRSRALEPVALQDLHPGSA